MHEKPRDPGNKLSRMPDLSSVEVRKALVSKLVAKEATVRRSSGDIETDWVITAVGQNGIQVSQDDPNRNGYAINKVVPLEEFFELNPELASFVIDPHN